MSIPYTIIELDRPRELRLTMRAVVEFERTNNVKFMELENEMSMDLCGKLLYTMLKQDDKALTYDAVIDLIDQHTSIYNVVQAVTEAMTLAFPAKAETEAAAEGVDGPKNEMMPTAAE